VSAVASLYSYALNDERRKSAFAPEFLESLANVNSKELAFKFIDRYGTHYVSQATMGAKFEETIRFADSMSNEEINKVQQDLSNNSFGINLDLAVPLLGKAGTSYDYTSKTEEKSTKKKISEFYDKISIHN